MTTAVGYCRVSGPSQISGDGFPRQSTAIAACCQSKDLDLIHEYHEEAVPGKLDEEHRPAFQQMIADLLGNGCRTIVIEGMHRLARAYRTQEHLIIYLASKGLTLIAADTGEDITAAMMGDPMRRALVQIQGVFAELEKSLLVIKLAKARDRQRAKLGKCEGPKTFGCLLGEAEILAQMISLRMAGHTCREIAYHLDEMSLKTRSGGRWSPGTISKILARQN